MWLTLIVAETISASSGLGYMAMQAREFLLIDVVVLSILIYALLGKLADSLARLLERLSLQVASRLPDRNEARPMTAATIAARRAFADRSGSAHRPTGRRRRAPSLSASVGKRFGDKVVLDGIDLEVAAGPVPRHHRQERLRQEHAAAAARRSRPADLRNA